MKKEELINLAWSEAKKINEQKGEVGVNAMEALEWLADKYLTDVVNGVSTSNGQALNLACVRILLAAFVNWYNNDKDCHCELYNEDVELFIAAYKS